MEADVRSGYLIKNLDLDLEKQLSLPISLGWVTSISKKAVSHSTVRNIIYKWKAFMRVASLPWSGHPNKFTSRSDRAMFRQITRNLRYISYSTGLSDHVKCQQS